MFNGIDINCSTSEEARTQCCDDHGPHDKLFLASLETLVRSLSTGGHRPLVDDHPVDTEPIPQLSKSSGEECFLHGHEDFAAVRQARKDALRLSVTLDAE